MVKNEVLIEDAITIIERQYADIASKQSIRFILNQKIDKFLKIVVQDAILIDRAVTDQELESLSNSSDDVFREMQSMKSI